MQVITTKAAARRWVYEQRARDSSVGLVPTMGALHAGHISLAQRSVQRCGATATTIFVNPIQFAPHEDLDRYPRTLDDDLEALANAGIDMVFAPDQGEMYAADFSTYVMPPKVGHHLEGQCRPDHFRGVTTVVTKLFHILPCTHAFFGQKDYQQACVLRQMTQDLDFGIEFEICPTVRAVDGLALSSRNRYLSAEQREQALGLYRALAAAKELFATGERSTSVLEQRMSQELHCRGVHEIDYAVVVDAVHLETAEQVTLPAIALIAAHVGGTRLIDNLPL